MDLLVFRTAQLRRYVVQRNREQRHPLALLSLSDSHKSRWGVSVSDSQAPDTLPRPCFQVVCVDRECNTYERHQAEIGGVERGVSSPYVSAKVAGAMQSIRRRASESRTE
jgi:hypothetical protein